jgi:hypothetical protein
VRLGLDQRKGDVAVEPGVVREEDALRAALTEEPSDLVASASELGRLLHRGRAGGMDAGLALPSARTPNEPK